MSVQSFIPVCMYVFSTKQSSCIHLLAVPCAILRHAKNGSFPDAVQVILLIVS
jgi:hypothetical protein